MDLNMTDPFAHLTRNNAADNNKQYILDALQRLNLLKGKVVEIGSGPGQHGIHFCQHVSELTWQPTEITSKLPLTLQWYEVSQKQGLTNYLKPFSFHIGRDTITASDFDLVYSANVLHIISEELAQHLIKQLVETMSQGQKLVCYGPFKQDGEYTSESNRDFDQWLFSEGYGGMQDLEDIPSWSDGKLSLLQVESMPANNFIVVYQKV
ncbi:hypothetical protein BTO11_06785 [Psychrosphaera saromensis]|uniref:Methylase n=2 Tax=Psychrosphaera saromensis TaxID=716813 RepID=A0A2S7UTX6_9GAMM|nr:hypothetical protein BTO11_06785 [Psychrosphaera saromensis]GLQ14815.1 methylase [Psychrosphaera saromensis]